MREARALPGPPARALSDDPRLWRGCGSESRSSRRSQAQPLLPRGDMEQTANPASHRDTSWPVPHLGRESFAYPRLGKGASTHEPRELGMTDDSDDRELSERLEDAERRLAAIAEIASGQVGATGMAEMDLEDAESRLNRIHDLATSSP